MRAEQKAQFAVDELKIQSEKVLDFFITCVVFALVPATALIVYFANQSGWGATEFARIGFFICIGLLALKRDRLSLRGRVYAISALLFLSCLAEIYRYGMLTASTPVLTILPTLSAVIGGLRVGIAAIVITVLGLVGMAWLSVSFTVMPTLNLPSDLTSPYEWGRHIAYFAISSLVAVCLTGYLFQFHQKSLRDLRKRGVQLVKSQSRLMQSAKIAGLGYAVVAPVSGRLLECDVTFAEMHGFTEEEAESLDIQSLLTGKIIYQDDHERAADTMSHLFKGDGADREYRHQFPSGQIRTIRKIFSPKDSEGLNEPVFEVVCQDVTAARGHQERMAQAQKMESIGTLTGGVAHDFNNLLAVIMGNLELLEDELKNPEHRDLIQNSIGATQRGAELTRNMLSFARRSQLEPSVVELNQLVKNIKSWTSRTLPSTIQVETSLIAGIWPIEVDPSSTESGLLNLILNARDAMPKGGRLTLETSNVRIDDDYVQTRNEEIPPGRYVLLAVSDTGEGIPPENLKNIFEPFFTTKPVNSGSGLGLSMLDGFMRQSGGMVRVYSELGVGTTFKLYFPATDRADTIRSEPPVVSDAFENLDTRGTILLVEDNVEVLEAIRATLVKAGFQVIQALSGDEALGVFHENPDIDLLLTDIVMPGTLQGTSLAVALRKIRPALKVVFMSGYAKEATVHGNGLQPQDIRLMKPVGRKDLLRAVSKALSLEADVLGR